MFLKGVFSVRGVKIAWFLSVDPLTRSYPFYTPYQFAGNMPVWAIDLDGKEPFHSTQWNYIFDYLEQTNEKFYGRTLGDWQHRATDEERLVLLGQFSIDVALSYGKAALEVDGVRIPISSRPAIITAKRITAWTKFTRILNPATWFKKKGRIPTGPGAWGRKPVDPEFSGREIAKQFMEDAGVQDTRGHLNAIDFDYSVRVKTLNKGDIIYRWDATDKMNQKLREHGYNLPEYFFDEVGTASQKLGVGGITKRELKTYRVTETIDVLESSVQLLGEKGGQQLFSPNLYRNLEKID